LVGKLDSASAKLSQGKIEGALINLASFRDKVITLAAQDKLDPAEAETLTEGADDAIACVGGLQTQAPMAA
jgi:hypothetical protein